MDRVELPGRGRAWVAWLIAAWVAGAPAPGSALVTIGALPLEESSDHVALDGAVAWVLSGDRDCFGCDRTLRAVDVSNPARPIELGSVNVGVAVGLELEGTRAFLPGPHLGVIDISDPGAPLPVPVQNYPRASHVDVAGDIAYVAAGDHLDVHDVSGIYGAPRLGRVAIPAQRVLVQGTLAYVAGSQRFSVVDVSDATAPRVLGEIAAGRFPEALAVRDGRAYLAEFDADGLRVIDVSDPAALRELTFLNHAASSLALDGELAYLGGPGLAAVDIGDPAEPFERGEMKTPSLVADIAIANGLCVVAAGASGVLVINLAEPSFPRELGAYAEAGHHAQDVEARDGRAVLAGSTLDVVDVSDPSAPTLAGRAPLPFPAIDLEWQDDLAFVADSSGMRVFHIPEAGDPIEIARHPTAGSVLDVELTGGVAYLAVSGGALELVDVSQPPLLRKRGHGLNAVFDLELAGGFAFALDLYDGVRVVDLLHPTLSRQRAFLGDFGALTVEVDRGRVWTAGRTVAGGFVRAVVPFLPPGAALPAEAPLSGDPRDLEIAGDRAYVGASFSACPDSGSLTVFDASRVSELGGHCLPGPVGGVDVAGGRIYVAAGGAGLRILDFGPEYAPEVREVAIDVQPHRPGFRAGAFSNKAVEVAVLGAADFDVRHVAALYLGPAQAPAERDFAVSDVNGDGFGDLVTAFRLRAAGVGRDDERLCLAGTLFDGTRVEGCDTAAARP